MNKTYPIALILFTVSFLSGRCFGWDATGHKVVALIAWEDMTPKTRAAVTQLLRQHARYDKDLVASSPPDESPDDQSRSVFAVAATWPDMVRSLSNPMSHTCNHPAWHYIDIPYATGGQQAVVKPSDGPGPHNIVEALTQCVGELKDTTTADPQKAIDVCWVEHLTGDIHQPLHAATWYSPDFPDGDQGGNAEVVLKTPPYQNSQEKLHFLWDSLAGDFASEEFMRFEASGLRADPRYSRDAMRDLLPTTDFMAWAMESDKLAIEDAYLNGQLSVAPAHPGEGSGPVPGVPPDYVFKAEHVAMHQLSLAGYRLADLLNGIFDPK